MLGGAQPSHRLQEKKIYHSPNLCCFLVAMTYTKLEQLATLIKDVITPLNLQTFVGWVYGYANRYQKTKKNKKTFSKPWPTFFYNNNKDCCNNRR
jgi:hypothetical protein